MLLTERLDERAAKFALSADGAHDGTAAAGRLGSIVQSGTGDLIGITGTCAGGATHDDYRFMPRCMTGSGEATANALGAIALASPTISMPR